MKAWTKPKEVEWFEYTGVTDAFRQWCSEVGLVLKDREGDPHIRVRDEDIEDVESSLPMTLYNSVCLPSCIIVKSGSCISRMPREHFEKHYTFAPSILTREFQEELFNHWSEEKDSVMQFLKTGSTIPWQGSDLSWKEWYDQYRKLCED